MRFQWCCAVSVCCVVLSSLVLAAAAGLTDYIRPCSAIDPLLNQCVISRAKTMWPHLIAGVKELGLVPMEPLLIPLVQLQQGHAGSGRGLDINLTNTKNYGWKDCVVQNVSVNLLHPHFEFNLVFPRYELIGHYQIRGRVLVLPIAGEGAANVTIENLHTKLVFAGKTEVRHGKKYLKLTDVRTSLTIMGKTYLNMDNLFGNKELSDGMNRFLNSNAKEVFNEFRPAIEEVIAELYWGMIASFLKKVPYNKLFLDLD